MPGLQRKLGAGRVDLHLFLPAILLFDVLLLPPSSHLSRDVVCYVALRRRRPLSATGDGLYPLKLPAMPWGMLAVAEPGAHADHPPMAVTLRGAASTATEWLLGQAEQWLIAVFTPGRATAVVGQPGWTLVGRSLEGDAFLGQLEHARLIHEVALQATVARKILVLEKFIAGSLASRIAPRVDEVWRELRHVVSQGRGPKVSVAAQRLRLSERQLERICKETFGLKPSDMMRLMRLHCIAQALRPGKGAPLLLSQVAASLGFSDLSHMTREVNALVGLPTSRWRNVLRERHPDAWSIWTLTQAQPADMGPWERVGQVA